MTVSAVVPVVKFAGSSSPGTSGPFSLVKSGTPITFSLNSHIEVYRYDTTDDLAPVLLTENTDYTLTGGPTAGSITLTSPQTGLLTAERLLVMRKQPVTQALSLSNGSNFSGPALEARFDRLVEMIAENAEKIGRAVKATTFGVEALPDFNLAAALGKIAFIDGTEDAPVWAYHEFDAADLSAIIDALDDLGIIAADLTGADTIGAVAAIAGDVSTVASIAADVTAVAAGLPAITTVAGAITDGTFSITKDTYATLTAIPAVDRTDGMVAYVKARTTAGDGADGYWRFDAASSATANGGTVLAPDAGTGRWHRITSENEFLWDWWGTTAAALSAAFAALPVTGGTVRARRGGDYTLSTQVTCDKSFVTFDMRGCYIRPRFTTGAAFLFGNGSTLCNQIAVIADGSGFVDGGTGGSAPQHPLFETRGVRTFTTRGIYAGDLWQVHKWGDPAGTIHSRWWLDIDCDWNMRSNANGGHSDAIQADGATGRWITNSSYEGDSANVSGSQVVFRLTEDQLSSISAGDRRFDELSRGAGSIWKRFDSGVGALDARIVNYQSDKAVRTDDMQDWCHTIVATSGATQGGCEAMSFNEQLAGLQAGGGIQITNGSASIQVKGIGIAVETQTLRKHAVSLVTSGSGAISGVTLTKLACNEFNPSDANQDVLHLDGDVQGVFDNITLTGISAGTDARYVVYNNTATAKRVKIGANIGWDAVGTAVIYDPNIGDLSIGRFCALRPDGTPRQRYAFTFGYSNVGGADTTELLFTSVAGSTNSIGIPAPERGRFVESLSGFLGTIVSGSLQIGPAISSTINTDLVYVYGSSDGANPTEVVTFTAGSAAIAKGALLQSRYTSSGPLSPTSLDAFNTIVFQEM